MEYLLQRGFTRETIEAWQITYSEEDHSVSIPTYKRSGRLVGVIQRHTTSELHPKYLYSPGFRIRHTLFGTHMFLDEPPLERVHVVEGPLDAIWMWQCGFPNTVAVLGAYLSTEQQRLLKRISNHVVLCLDNDQPGKEARNKMAPRLIKDGFRVDVAILQDGKKDVQEHSAQELRTVLLTAEPFLLVRISESTLSELSSVV